MKTIAKKKKKKEGREIRRGFFLSDGYFIAGDDQSDSQCVRADTAECVPLGGPFRQNSQIRFVVLAHARTFRPGISEESEEKTFPFNFSHSHTERGTLSDTVELSLHFHGK